MELTFLYPSPQSSLWDWYSFQSAAQYRLVDGQYISALNLIHKIFFLSIEFSLAFSAYM